MKNVQNPVYCNQLSYKLKYLKILQLIVKWKSGSNIFLGLFSKLGSVHNRVKYNCIITIPNWFSYLLSIAFSWISCPLHRFQNTKEIHFHFYLRFPDEIVRSEFKINFFLPLCYSLSTFLYPPFSLSRYLLRQEISLLWLQFGQSELPSSLPLNFVASTK